MALGWSIVGVVRTSSSTGKGKVSRTTTIHIMISAIVRSPGHNST
jgi:hypothetical protein